MPTSASMAGLIAVAGALKPGTVANSEQFSDVIDLSLFSEVMAVVLLGDMASETIDFRVVKCDSNGANPSATIRNITQLAASATANDGKIAVIHLFGDDLNTISQAARYAKFGVVTGGATGGPVAICVLGTPRYGAAAAQTANVLQVV